MSEQKSQAQGLHLTLSKWTRGTVVNSDQPESYKPGGWLFYLVPVTKEGLRYSVVLLRSKQVISLCDFLPSRKMAASKTGFRVSRLEHKLLTIVCTNLLPSY